jgi:hypothetical protein
MAKKKHKGQHEPKEEIVKQEEIMDDSVDQSHDVDTTQQDKLTEDMPEIDEIRAEDKERESKEESDESAGTAPVAAASAPTDNTGRSWKRLLRDKKIVIPAVIVLALAVLAAVPVTRYALAGTVLKQRFSLKIVDTETKKPISGVTVQLDGKKATTDKDGKANVKVSVGDAKLTVEKKYYESESREVLVPILKQKDTLEVRIKATGRQVPVAVVNKITKEPLADAAVKVLGTETKTGKDGKAVLVLPADKTSAEATVSHDGYNSVATKIEITTKEVAANNFSLTPEGKIFFLSNLSGKLDVVKSNLDGTGREVVLAGTGKEDKNSTILLASRDWKYLTLKSRRDGGEYDKLFLIETATGKVTTMDEGEATFSVYGWADHRFVYKVERQKVEEHQPKKYAIKSFNAEAKKITTLDQSEAQYSASSGRYAAQRFDTVYIAGDKLIYGVEWGGWYESVQNRLMAIRTIGVDGSGKRDVKTFSTNRYSSYFTSKPYAFNEVYYEVYDNDTNEYIYFEYEDGKVVSADIDSSEFSQEYPIYFISPSAKRTLWSEERDGKNVFFLGDENGEHEKRIAALEEFSTYGWYTDKYALVSKKGNELYIMAASELQPGQQPLKITNYHRPNYNIPGYGGGY